MVSLSANCSLVALFCILSLEPSYGTQCVLKIQVLTPRYVFYTKNVAINWKQNVCTADKKKHKKRKEEQKKKEKQN